jgi:hypothetical protein
VEFEQPANVHTATNDEALTIALAEYEHVRQLRIAHTDNASNQVGQLFIGASVAVAAIAGLVGLAGDNIGDAVPVALLGIGCTVFGLGVLVYLRMQRTRRWRFIYDTSLAALRTYMVRRVPEIRPYVLEGILGTDPAKFRPHRRGVLLVIVLANSIVVGLVGGYAAWLYVARQPAVSAIVGTLGFVVALASHVTSDRRLVARTNRLIEARKARRGWSGVSAPNEQEPEVSPNP